MVIRTDVRLFPTTPSEARPRFERLASSWKEKVRFLSNERQMVLLPEYQRIIGMGESAVPFLLEQLERDPHWWFWALEMITGDDPVPAEAKGHLDRMAKAWLDWGREKGFVADGPA
jgi:hypothetical protein